MSHRSCPILIIHYNLIQAHLLFIQFYAVSSIYNYSVCVSPSQLQLLTALNLTSLLPHDPHQPLENLVSIFSTSSPRSVSHIDTCTNDHQRHLHVPLHGDLLLLHPSDSVGLPLHHLFATDSAHHRRLLFYVPVLLPDHRRPCVRLQRTHRSVHRMDRSSSAVHRDCWNSRQPVSATHPDEDVV